MVLAESRPKLVDAVERGSIVIVGRTPTVPHLITSGFGGNICSLELSGSGKNVYC